MDSLLGNQEQKADAVEMCGFGVTRQYLFDRRIMVIRTEGDMGQAAVDRWAQTVIESVQTWQRGRPILVLHDLSTRSQGLTPYARRRAEEIYTYAPPDVLCAVALVLAPGVMTRLVQLLLRLPSFNRPNVQQQIFTDEARALFWLQQRMHPD